YELDDPSYLANPTNRCFFCKTELWRRLVPEARARGLAVVCDGTNADDLGEHRPGYAAGLAAGVRSPLAEAGFTKADVRAAAREPPGARVRPARAGGRWGRRGERTRSARGSGLGRDRRGRGGGRGVGGEARAAAEGCRGWAGAGEPEGPGSRERAEGRGRGL